MGLGERETVFEVLGDNVAAMHTVDERAASIRLAQRLIRFDEVDERRVVEVSIHLLKGKFIEIQRLHEVAAVAIELITENRNENAHIAREILLRVLAQQKCVFGLQVEVEVKRDLEKLTVKGLIFL